MKRISPKLQKMVDKTAPDFNRKINFNKKFRDKVRRDFLKLRDESIKIIENTPHVQTLKESKDRLLAESFLDLAINYVKFCDKAERHQKFYNQTGKFVLYRKGNEFVFNNKTVRDKKLKEGNLIFSKGLPKSTQKRAVLKKFAMDLSEYNQIDSGKYHLKQTDFYNGHFHFWGKKKKYFINFTMLPGSVKKVILLKCEMVI